MTATTVAADDKVAKRSVVAWKYSLHLGGLGGQGGILAVHMQWQNVP